MALSCGGKCSQYKDYYVAESCVPLNTANEHGLEGWYFGLPRVFDFSCYVLMELSSLRTSFMLRNKKTPNHCSRTSVSIMQCFGCVYNTH